VKKAIVQEMGALADKAYTAYLQGKKFSIDENSYTVVAVSDMPSGFQGMLVEELNAQGDGIGKYNFAFRGTETPEGFGWLNPFQYDQFIKDLIVADLAYMGTGIVPQQMKDAMTFVQAQIDVYGLNASNTVFTGHSLGGSIAGMASYVFGFDAYTYNGFGIASMLWDVHDTTAFEYSMEMATDPNGQPVPGTDAYQTLGEYLETLDVTVQHSTDRIVNIVQNGYAVSDLVGGILTDIVSGQVGETHFVINHTGDAGGLLANHSITSLNQSIEIYNNILTLFPNETYESLGAAIQYLNPADNKISRLLTCLGELGGIDSINASEHLQMSEEVAKAHDAVGDLSLGFLAVSSAGVLAASATSSRINNLDLDNKAELYALLRLLPFIINGNSALYTQFPELNETYSDQFVADRKDFLFHLTCPSETTTDTIEFFDETLDIAAYSNADLPAKMRSRYLFGSKDNDNNLTGGNQGDHIYGLGGNDILSGAGGDDFLEGGKGQDVMQGGTGNDLFYIQGQDTDYDVFHGGEGTDTILGGLGDDTIRVHELLVRDSIEMIDGGEGNNIISGTDKSDIIDLSATHLTDIAEIHGEGGDDTITGTSDNDNIFGDEGADTLIGGAGNDTLTGGAGIDTYVIRSGDGADTIVDEGNNILMVNGAVIAGVFSRIEGTNRYVLTINKQDLTLAFGATATLTIDESTRLTFANQTSEADFAEHAFGITLCEQQTQERTLIGDDDDDIVFGTHDSFTWYFGFSGTIDGMGVRDYFLDDWKMFGYTAADAVAPSLQIKGNGGNDHLAGLAGEDTLTGGEGNDVLVGDLDLTPVGAGPFPDAPAWQGTGMGDQLWGDTGRDALFGGQGNDLLFGGDGNDVLSGEQDEDMLDGGNGDDLLAGGDGNDRLIGGGGNDVLCGDANVNSDADWSSIDMITWGLTTEYGADGWVVSLSVQGFSLEQAQMPGDDHLMGGVGNDFLLGGGGRDLLFGEAGSDRLEGGADDDCLDGGADNDLLLGEAGNDELRGGTGDDVLQGGIGGDTLQGDGGNDVLFGNEGNDTLTGGEGNDYLDGGDGSDIYCFGAGFGHDTISDTGLSGTDTVRFLDQIQPEDVDIVRYQDHLILFLDGGKATLALMNWYTSGDSPSQRLEFADGTVWDEAAITTFLTEAASPSTDSNSDPDTLTTATLDADGTSVRIGDRYIPLPAGFIGGGTLSEWDLMHIRAYGNYRLAKIEAGDGSSILDRRILGTGFDDYLYGGLGDDSLYGYGGNDSLSAGGGDDLIYGGIGQDRLLGGDGFDSLFGEEGDDTLDGGEGNDYLSDTKGNNILLGGKGDDQLLGGSGNDFMDGGDGDDTLLNIYDGGHDEMHGGTGDDRLTAGNGNDTLDGGDGNDQLYGGGGNDTLEGGRGNDYLFDDEGENTFLFNRGDGQDTIDGASVGTLVFAAGISPEDVVVSRSRLSSDAIGTYVGCDDLIFSFAGTDDQVTVTGWANNRNLQVQFNDGTVWDTSVLQQIPIVGTDGDDKVFNFWQDHSLQGGRYDDILDGGGGNDDLFGGGGRDIFLFGRGDGQDTVFAGLGTETIRFKAGVAPEDVISWIEDGNLCLAIKDTDDRVTVQRELSHLILGNYLGCQVDRVEFADGTVWDEAVLYGAPFELQGTGSADVMSGTVNTDVFSGGSGKDILDTGDGDDFLDGGIGKDSLTGGAGADHFLFTTPLDPANIDTIADFTTGEDTIQLSMAIFTALPSTGSLSGDLFTANAAGVATDADDYFLYNTSTGALLYDADGTGTGAAVQFALLASKPEISANDFLVAA